MIFMLNICNKVSICNEAVNIIKIADIKRMVIFSLKWRISATELIPILASVIPIAVTDNSPVSAISSSATVKHAMTTTNTAGDFKNSGICPDSNIQLYLRSEEHTSELQSRGHLVCRLLLEKKKKSRR